MDGLLFPFTLTVSLVLLLPVLFVGILILLRPKASVFSSFAAWMSIKPFLTTPLWLSLGVFVFPEKPFIVLSLLPAWIYTIICIGYYYVWKRMKLTEQVLVLLVIDFIRWGNALLLIINETGEAWGLVIMGFLYTYIFVITAYVFVSGKERKHE